MTDFFARRQKQTAFAADAEITEISVKERAVPWVEKYRPKKVDDLCFQEEIVSVMKTVLAGGILPHMLFYGPPGTGKTSAAVALARELFGKHYKDRVLSMNASDDRGIQVVRNRIKEFSRLASCPLKRTVDGQELTISLKIVILDEADAMTSAAQAAMRRTIEKYSKTTRFFLICNYVSRIITPLVSRCAKFRFKPLPMESQIDRMKYIAVQEGVNCEDAALVRLIELCEGDLRKSITYLQAVAKSCNVFTVDVVQEMVGRVPDKEIDRLLTACKEPHFEGMMEAIERVRRLGFVGTQLIAQLLDKVLELDEIPDINKAEIVEAMAVAEGRLIGRADGYLNLLDVAATIQKQYLIATQ